MQNSYCTIASLNWSDTFGSARVPISTKDWSFLGGTDHPKQPATSLNMISHDELKQKQRHLREGFPEDIGLRIHRAISWVGRAEKEKQDYDAAFIFLWIAFNSAYAGEAEGDAERSLGERQQFIDLIDRLVERDADGRLYTAVWDRFRGPIATLMENRFVYRPFWLNQNGIPGNENWAKRFKSSAERFVRSMADKDTAYVLREVFDRLYMLRCQMMHGGTTWNSKVNRQQVRDGAQILQTLLPVMLDIMMDNPEDDWGRPFYPVVTVPAARGSAGQRRI
ncbi:hypothetical protein RUE5091_00117 [Ruegeria denitrificans]|uniref:Uncharacterized protein n=1 Tax=Ruegeria denitrificans TaxID=1715692 RepID=A0A0P1ID76_9RHOB|nr:HEPN domain-containing protein [Ruegeria denitrificans]CUJ83495.1 hypothetical protein RUE5091_00117 [Ruegeria denitrificans]